MNLLASLFLNNLAPIFLITGAGYLLGRFTPLNPRTLSQVIFYLFSPALLFTLLTTSDVSGLEIFRVMSFATVSICLIGAITFVAGKMLRLERSLLAGVLLVAMFMNAGNYGLPVVLFAFGTEALSFASLYFSMNAILAYTLGTVIASSGTTSLARAFGNLLRIPTVYGLALAMIFMFTGWTVPPFLARTTKLLGDSSIPAMLVLLGLQLHYASWKETKAALALAGGMRMLVAPLLTILLAPLFGLSGAAHQAVVLESAMPTAVLNTTLATEFEAQPAFVSAAVFITTILSPLTITPLLAWLGAA